MGTMRRTFRYTLITAGLLLAACEAGTAPDAATTFDSEGTLSAYAAMDSLTTSAAFAGFEALSGRTPYSGTAAAVDAVAALAGAGRADGGRAFALALASGMRTDATGPAGAPIISDTHRGSTFVYDPETDEYAVDPERDGAPVTGVRFVLYEVDLLGTPMVDEEIGYADLVDEGDESTEDVSLALTVVAHETTVLEYRTTLDVRLTGGSLGVHGALQDEVGRRLDFDIDATATKVLEHTSLDVAFEMRVDARDFSIVGSVSGVEEGVEGDGSVELVVRHRDDSVRVDVDGAAGRIDGSIFVNGALFATVTGDASNPDIASATGESLTLREILVLHRIVDGAEDIFDFLEDLLDPVDELVLLAIIL
jgi:hypothetical protein